MVLPGHAESYNPPEEYLFDEQEKQHWEMLDAPDRHISVIPQKYDSLRTTPSFQNFQRERFQRCLDLYLAIRAHKKRRWFDPDSLVPKIPRPSELKPFPSQLTITYEGHESYVRTIDVDPTGQWIISGSDDMTVRIWEIATGRQVQKWTFPKIINKVAWNPNPEICVFAVLTDFELNLLTCDEISSVPQRANTQKLFELQSEQNTPLNDNVKGVVEWVLPENDQMESGFRSTILWKKADQPLKFVTWHHKGDYFSTVCPGASRLAVLIHHMSKKQSQCPFKKSKGLIQCVQFHPSKPYFFVATQTNVRVYNLTQQVLSKKLLSGAKWISSMHVHPGGDNLIITSYDKRVCWFDLDLSNTPYKTLRYHKFAIRQSAFHPKYPLFASCSDDGHIHVFHGMVYNDLLQNPFIVPLKILKGHTVEDDLGVLDVVFHPHQPWIFSSGADKTIRLFT